MSVTIKTITAKESYSVNDKEVYLDSNGNWIAKEELTNHELKSFRQFRASIEECCKQDCNECEE